MAQIITAIRLKLLFIALLLPLSTSVLAQQIVFEETFDYADDEDFQTNSPWLGDLEDFTLVTENGNQLLRLDADEAGTSQLRTNSTTAYGTWEFFIDQDFPPSNANRGFIFIISDIEDLSGNVNGYAIRTGENSSPNFFRLFRFTNGSATEILTGDLDISSGGPYQVRVTRDNEGNWALYESEGYGSTPVLADQTIDNTHTTSNFFGFQLSYTITRATNFYFDDIIIKDGIDPLTILNVEVESGNSIRATFTEEVDASTVVTENFSLNGVGPQTATVDPSENNVVILEFNNLDEGSNTLVINDLQDFRGNVIEPNTSFEFTVENPFEIVSVEAVQGDRIEVEFTEPPDEDDLLPANFNLVDESTQVSQIDYDENTAPNTIFLELDGSLPIGNYTLAVNGLHSTAGWPLAGDTEIPFSVENPFFVTDFEILSRQEFDITFSQDVQAPTVVSANFDIPGAGSPQTAQLEDPDRVRISYTNPVDLGEQELIMNGLISTEGWEIESDTSIEFILFDEYEDGDLVISEFYYRTPTSWRTAEFDRPQYVEIYNRTGKLLNLRNFTINGQNISIETDLPISGGQYLVITRGVPVFEQQFGERNFVEADEFPSLNLTTSSSIIFETDTGDLIEELTYVASTWGGNEVSLERYSFDAPAGFRDNWAESEDALTGSPGLPNTVTMPTDPPEAIAAAFPEPRTLRITFSRTLSEETALDLSNFSLDNNAEFTSVDYTSDERTLEFKTEEVLEDQFEYTLSYQNIEDILGNEISGIQQFNFTFENPFRILTATLEDETRLRVVFTFPINVSQASVSDFQLSDGTGPVSLNHPNSETAELTFSEPFEVGEYEIVVNNIISQNPEISEQWQIESNSTATFYRFDEYQSGDIVLNEFMYRPPDGYPRYVELHNRSDRFLNLRDWELRRAEGAANNGGVFSEFDIPIEPNGFLVITTNKELLEDIFGAGPWFQMNNFPGFTQTVPDRIRLIDSEGDLVEFVDYDPSDWGGNGVALERRRPDLQANSRENWGESPNELLGTPGQENEVDDAFDLVVSNVEVITGSRLLVIFNADIDESTVVESNFSVNGTSPESASVEESNEVMLEFDANLSVGQRTLAVSNIQTPGGFQIADNFQFNFTVFNEYQDGDIVITEFMYRPPDGYPRYVEIHNISNRLLNLRDWELRRQEGAVSNGGVFMEEDLAIGPGQYVVITNNEEQLSEIFGSGPWVHMSNYPGLTQTVPDQIRLINSEGNLVESINYEPSTWGGNGVSLERRSVGVSANDINNWGESLAELLGTPGQPNTIGPLEEGPQLVNVSFISADTLSVQFTGALDQDAIGPGNFSLSSGIAISDVEFVNSVNLRLILSSSMSSGTAYTLTVTDIRDIFGNVLDEEQAMFTYYEFETAEPGDVVINEFMYNEPDGYTRYIELFNRSSKAIDLAGWQQANDTGTRRTIANEQVVLAPGSYIVILPNEQLLDIFPDIHFINAGGRLSALKNGGDEIVITNAEGITIDSLRYSPDWGGDGVALERRRSGLPSVYPENWAESPSEELGTPGAPNAVDSNFDLIASDIRTVGRDEVMVVFNANIEESSVITGNFSVNGTVPSIAALTEKNQVMLTFSDGLPTGELTLTINNIQTLGGFQIADNSQFTFAVFDEFEEGDIVINEFMYRPPTGYARYVELYNHSGKILNLRNWRLQRRQVSTESERIITSEDLLIEPGNFVVITDNADVMTGIFGERDYVEMPNFPSFTLTVADQIRLFTNEDALADSLEYNPSDWGGNGVALERLSPDVPATFRENWAESPSELLGTPGLPNEAQPDPNPPELISASQYEDLGFILQFSKQLDSERATDISNYSVEPSVSVGMVALDRNEVILFINDELVNDQVYEISVSGLTDIFGNQMDPATVSVRYLEFGEVQPQQIVINEILYRRLDSSSPEFVEIFNRSDINFDLSGWSLSDASGSAAIPPGTAIRENDYLVFTDMESFAAGSDKIIYLPGFRSLSNTADAVVLRNGNSVAIDSVFYEAAWYNNPAGVSLERKDPAALSIDQANWAMSTDDRGSTPAETNSRFEPDETPPNIIFANVFHPDSIEVIFNEFIDLRNDEDESGANLAKQNSQRSAVNNDTRFLLNGTETDVLKYNPARGNRVVLDGSAAVPGEEIILVIENLGDFQGNIELQQDQPVAQPLSPGDLVFNEIMYNPIADSHDGIQDQSEYIEIYNRMPYAISLEGIFLHDEPDENNQISRIDPETSTARWIPANGYALFYPEPDRIPFSNSRTALFFELSEDFAPFAFRAARTTLSLPNAGRQVYLADSTRTTIDMVQYRPDWHNPNIVDTRGIALERINPDLSTNDPSNWSSNTSPMGGTPGSENTIFQVPDSELTDTGVFLDPNPFSPDGSGFEDNMFINYVFDEPDYMLRIRIYDRYGRLVRNLVEGQPAGFEGSIIWDGRTDNGQRNRIGIYIVLVEAYNSSNGQNRTFKETAVIARQF